tara:strand:+ start:7959 stop:8291 length:333 start_codon:yes stop_codon:yes gene_type:complete
LSLSSFEFRFCLANPIAIDGAILISPYVFGKYVLVSEVIIIDPVATVGTFEVPALFNQDVGRHSSRDCETVGVTGPSAIHGGKISVSEFLSSKTARSSRTGGEDNPTCPF